MLAQYVVFPIKRAYGIELEVSDNGFSKQDIATDISKIDEVNVYDWYESSNNKDWHVKKDSTCGWEIASCKSKGVKSLQKIVKITDSLNSLGLKVTNKCGFHIHVEVKDFSSDQIATLVAIWLKIEKVIINAVPEHRINNKYCVLLNEYYSRYKLPSGLSAEVFAHWIKPDIYGNRNRQRRVAMNIWNFYTSYDRKTVEFRFPEGTLDSNDVKNWIRLFVRFVHFNKNQAFPTNFDETNLVDTLKLLGLAGDSDFFVLSPGMHETKKWFLYRLMKYSRSKSLCADTIVELNKMFSPLKTYKLSEDCESYIESL